MDRYFQDSAWFLNLANTKPFIIEDSQGLGCSCHTQTTWILWRWDQNDINLHISNYKTKERKLFQNLCVGNATNTRSDMRANAVSSWLSTQEESQALII